MSSTKFDPAAFDAAVAGPNGWDGVSDPVAEVRKMRGDEETLDDIEREMREAAKSEDLFNGEEVGEPLIRGTRVLLWADRIEAAEKRMEVELREDEAKMLLREYAAAPDESLTPSALALKRELLALAPQDDNAKLREAPERLEGRQSMKHKVSLDDALHCIACFLVDDSIVWRKTCVPWIRSYYAEDRLYLLRNMRYSHPSFALVYAKSPDEAAKYQRKHGGWGRMPASVRRSRERYQEWLRADSGLSLAEWIGARGKRP